ncbi:MAG: hypothetical protein JO227_17875 [Acetobacteraceae bacterium]|nr:hypothetical protein [Acetobacteraceae bacterium]
MHDQSPTNEEPVDQVAELRAHTAALEKQLAEERQRAETRIIRAELKAEALRAGIIDVDGLKLIDLSTAKLNDKGEVEGAAQMLAGLKRAKPWLFGASSSSSTSSPPPAQPPKQKLATEMTDAEYRAAREALLKQRF